jgi:hypothetical protein
LHGVDDLRPDEDVALDGGPVAGDAARPVVAGRSGERRGASGRVDDASLALVAALVGGEQGVERLLRGLAVGEHAQAVRAVLHVGVGLGRDGSDGRPCGGNDGADGEELRGDGHAPGQPVGASRHDRESHVGNLLPIHSLFIAMPARRRPVTRNSADPTKEARHAP